MNGEQKLTNNPPPPGECTKSPSPYDLGISRVGSTGQKRCRHMDPKSVNPYDLRQVARAQRLFGPRHLVVLGRGWN